MPRQTDQEAAGASARIPKHLDEQARAEIREAQAVMRQLIERLPRHFSYADEIALIFRPRRGD